MNSKKNLKISIQKLLKSTLDSDIIMAIELSKNLDVKSRKTFIKFIFNKCSWNDFNKSMPFKLREYRFSSDIKNECYIRNFEFIIEN